MNDYKKTNSWSLLEQALKEATEIKTPELTIDLPHNQKLTIGQLKPDTIVEIATWRGVGAPDENSVRMLIGASLQNGSEMAAENEAAAAAVVAEVVSEVAEAFTGRPEETKVDNEIDLPEPAAIEKPTEFQKELSRKTMRMQANKKNAKFKIFSIFGSFAALALIIGGLNVAGFLAFDHPQVGPELPLGSSTNSLVAIVPGTSAQPGDFAMATIDGVRNFVRVDAVSAIGFTVSTMDGSREITGDQLDGKMSFLIPFIGFFWTLFGQ